MNRKLRIIVLSIILGCSLIVPVSACTVFMATDDTSVLFGNNEDWYDVDKHIQFVPGNDDKYGAVILISSARASTGKL